MIVEPKSKGFICTTAHPTGCCKNVEEQIEYAKKAGESFAADKEKTWKKVLIIGASTGYGLASRIAAAFTCKADTIGAGIIRRLSIKWQKRRGCIPNPLTGMHFPMKPRKKSLKRSKKIWEKWIWSFIPLRLPEEPHLTETVIHRY